MGLTCVLVIFVAMVTMTSAAPLEEENIKRTLEDLRVLEDLRWLEALEGTLSKKQSNVLGIKADPEVFQLYNAMRLNRAYKWCTFKIQNRRWIVRDECRAGDPGLVDAADEGAWNGLVSTLTNEPRYIIYDIDFNMGSEHIKKVFFMFWVPDVARIRDKMDYAGAKNTVKMEFPGLAVEFKANGKGDLDYPTIKEVVEKKAY